MSLSSAILLGLKKVYQTRQKGSLSQCKFQEITRQTFNGNLVNIAHEGYIAWTLSKLRFSSSEMIDIANIEHRVKSLSLLTKLLDTAAKTGVAQSECDWGRGRVCWEYYNEGE